MELVNATRKAIDSGCGGSDPAVREAAEVIAIALSLVAPYTAEEMWQILGHEPAIANAGWPVVDPVLLADDSVEVVLQINGKIIDRLDVSPSITKEELELAARSNEKMSAALAGADIKKAIVVAPKLVNFVI